MEAVFDVETAIETRLANRPKDEIERWEKYQKEHSVTLRDPRTEHAYRAINIATTNLAKGLEPTDEDFEYTRMAEGYYLLGEFARAAELTRNEDKKNEYQALVNASPILCTCPNVKIGKVYLSPRFTIDRFPGKEIIRCTTCNKLYVKTLS